MEMGSLKKVLRKKKYIRIKLKKIVTNHLELSAKINGVKGKFILSLNVSPNIRNIFKDFNIRGITVGSSNSNENIGGKSRKEVIIKNF